MKKILMALSIAASATPALSNADTILGLYAGLGQWNAGFGGDIGDEAEPTKLEDSETMQIKDDSSNVLWAKFEHPVPFVPNVMLKSTGLSTQVNIDATAEPVNLGTSTELSDLNSNVSADIDLGHIDATLYYEVLDNWLTLDLGITARKFSGHFNVYDEDNAGTAISSSDISGTIPLLYMSGQFDLPFTGFHAGLNTHVISISDNSITDTSIYAGYSTGMIPLFDIGLNIGYRSLTLSLDELDDTYVDVGFDGAFVELIAHF